MEKSVKNIGDTEANVSKTNAKAPVIAKESESVASKAQSTEGGGEPEKKAKRTVGNKIYDFGVFGSIAWLGVSAVSALTAHEAMHGNNKYFNWLRTANKATFNKVSSFLSKNVMKKSPKETVDAVANNTTMVFTLGMGGHVLMAPIKWLEDNRETNAAKIDKALGTTPADAKIIANEPKQSWGSVFSGRLLAWGATFVAALTFSPRLVSKANKYFGDMGSDAWMKIKPKANPLKVKRWSNLIAFDLMFAALTAAVTYGFSRFVANKYDKGGNLYELNPIAPNPFGEEGQHEEKQPKKKVKTFADTIKLEQKDKKRERSSGSFIEKLNGENNIGQARV